MPNKFYDLDYNLNYLNKQHLRKIAKFMQTATTILY